ncbi:hypothetical protein TcYC6_0107030 [Trypanosoma cruzi]|nr:hypothetical protein TcYC6_0107030 [Trypanosoma cruzi]
MYRFCCRGAVWRPINRSHVLSGLAWCASQGVPPTDDGKPREAARHVAPSDEDVAEMLTADREVPTSRTGSKLSDAAMEFTRVDSVDDTGGRKHAEHFRDATDFDGEEDDDDDEDIDDVRRRPSHVHGHGGRRTAEDLLADENELPHESDETASSPPIDILLGAEDEVAEPSVLHPIAERQAVARTMNAVELVEMLVLYLRATENPRLVSAEEEHVLFPVVMERLNELHLGQMLDIVECHWARSTLVRYGITFKDMVRDRIAMLASVAGKDAAQKPKRASRVDKGFGEDDDVTNDVDDDVDDDADAGEVYAHEVKAPTLDPILLQARDEMNAEGVLRCIIVMGMSAGRRKRDLQFFQAMGMFLVHHVNHYKDPHDLVRVLTAFARAKIVPPKGFLALLGRRFAVLNKRKPLGALPSYRAFVNLYKMGHDQMNNFRFLANCIYESMDANVKSEKKRQRLLELQKKSGTTDAASADATKTTAQSESAESNEDGSKMERMMMTGDLDPQLLQFIKARERFKRLTELKPSMFTKLLLVLARFGAPHQQYLRPTIVPLILPTLRCFPPPSFSRLLRALYLFRTTDLELIEPIIDYLADDLGVQSVIPEDVLEMIRIVSPAEAPVPRNLSKILLLCESVYAGVDAAPVRLILPTDMCSVAAALLRIQMKEDVPLDALDPLTRLMEVFADRLYSLLQLHVVSLTHVDIFADLCRQQQHPDASGKIARLIQERRRLSSTEGDDDYYSRLDIDVRETFHKIMVVNDFKTYGQYRPTPGVLQVDFKQALTEVSAFDVLEATHLFAQAFPNTLRPTVVRHLSRSIIAKLGDSGEEVITEDNTMVLRPPRELLLTKEDLVKFVELVQATPLKRVKESPVVWRFIEEKARRLRMSELLKTVEQQAVVATA